MGERQKSTTSGAFPFFTYCLSQGLSPNLELPLATLVDQIVVSVSVSVSTLELQRRASRAGFSTGAAGLLLV